MLVAAAAQIPAMWLVVAVGVTLFGAAPKLSVAAWGVAGLALAISMFGPVLDVPQVVLDLSPFSHVPKLPGAEVTATPLVLLCAAGALALAAGSAPSVDATSARPPTRTRIAGGRAVTDASSGMFAVAASGRYRGRDLGCQGAPRSTFPRTCCTGAIQVSWGVSTGRHRELLDTDRVCPPRRRTEEEVLVAAEALEQSVLESKDKDQLLAIAKALGLKASARTKKSDIIDQILETTGSRAAAPATAPPTATARASTARPPTATRPAPWPSRTVARAGDRRDGAGDARPRCAGADRGGADGRRRAAGRVGAGRRRRRDDGRRRHRGGQRRPRQHAGRGRRRPRASRGSVRPANGRAARAQRRRGPAAGRRPAGAARLGPAGRGRREPQPAAPPPPQGRRPGPRRSAGRRRRSSRRRRRGRAAAPTPSRSRCRATSTCATRATASCA